MTAIAITGGAGRIGTALRRILAPRFDHIRTIDIAAPAALGANESAVIADIVDVEALTAAFKGMDGIVHLAGYINDGMPVEEMVRVNVLGGYQIYEAARRAGVGRVVVGSSNHAMGFYPRSERIGTDLPMRPDGVYGLGKCWTELTAGLFYDKAGIRSLLIRIGNAQERPTTPRSVKIWISARDLAQLVMIGLTHPDIDCTTVYGVSAGAGEWYDNAEAERLGYRPVDKAADFATPEAREPHPGRLPVIEDYFQGGPFCANGHDGILRRRG